tara:strand:+ start:631 stop:954 length:324 start_codon:yes stop_codon:yes gene_type:complete
MIVDRLRIGLGQMVKAPTVGKIAHLAEGPPLAVLNVQVEVQVLLLLGLLAQLQGSLGVDALVAAQEAALHRGPKERRRVDGAGDKKNYSQWMRLRTLLKTPQFQRVK